MTDVTSAAPGAFRDGPDTEDLRTVRQEFGLGAIQDATFLAEGLIDRNWRLDTSAWRVRIDRHHL